MAHVLIILIRTLLGIVACVAGLLLITIGLYFVFDANFPQLELVVAIAALISIGMPLLYIGWRLLASTLRLPTTVSR